MEITLSPEIEAVVRRDMETGGYSSVEDYIADAVETLHERREWLGETLAEERVKFERSLAEAERGELFTEDEVRQQMRAMKAEWALRRAG
jgi:Arc/MetJ-type ribon-helix-helix transcriptional regulator